VCSDPKPLPKTLPRLWCEGDIPAPHFMNVLRYVLLGLAACVLVVLGLRLTNLQAPTGASRPGPAQSSDDGQLASARKLVEARMSEVPQFADFYRQLGEAFPRSYAGVVDSFSRKLVTSGTFPSAEAMILESLRQLQQSQGVLAARASAAPLSALFAARLAFLDALAPIDPKQCADFLYGNADLPFADFSTQHRALVADLATKQLAAMKDGQERHDPHEIPTAADFDLIAKGLAAKNLTADEISVLLDGKNVDPPIPDARLCEMGRAYLGVLHDLPDDARQRVYGLAAELLARS
jgi:hypothetical protein